MELMVIKFCCFNDRVIWFYSVDKKICSEDYNLSKFRMCHVDMIRKQTYKNLILTIFSRPIWYKYVMYIRTLNLLRFSY